MSLNLEKSLSTYLLAQAGLTALVGTRIYANVLPDNATCPAVCFRVVDAHPVVCFNAAESTVEKTLIVECTSDAAGGYNSAKLVRDQVHTALDRYAGTLCTGGATVAMCLLENETDDYEDEPLRYIVEMTFTVWQSV
jgi:hypothetical protein